MKTQFKTNIIERYEKGESSRQISKNEGCSYNAVLRELKRKEINTGLCFWTEREKEKLKEFYPIRSNKELLKEFPNRAKKSIISMATKLRLKKKEYKEICKNCRIKFLIKFRSKYNKEGFCIKCVKKQWENNNPESGRKRKKRWIKENSEYMNQYYKRLRKENPKYRLDCNMGNLIYQSLKKNKKGLRWELLVDYVLADLIKHIERKFDEKMNWNNYGSYWHIDHIKPRSLFKYTFLDDLEFKKCWALENLQPLEKHANFIKNNKFIG
ncbi:MAG: hypothetical protein ABH956_01290 [Candidatus Nealsonbacteria bacterium]